MWSRALAVIGMASIAVVVSSCTAPAGGASATAASGPELKIALITHGAAGDTFWDIVRKGATTAADKDNIDLLYSSDPDGGKQAQLVQQAIDQKVDGIVVTLAKADAMSSAVTAATAAGIPVVSINSGEDASKALGALAHFGQNESVAGESAGDRLNELGAHRVLCVIHEQGNVGLESRCDGLAKSFEGTTDVLYVTGTDMTNVSSTITSKLQTNTDIDYVVTLGAPFAMTAIGSIADAGSSAKLATFDMNSDAIKALKVGSIQFLVDQQPYLQGYQAVDNLWLYLTNGNMLGGGKTVLTGPQIITADQADAIAGFAANGTR
jgi:simple sugar transport system substrate-binding protein